LEQLEIKQAELNQANEQAKEELLNKYGLQISKTKSESPDDSEICPVELFEKYEWDCVNHINEWTP